MREAVKLDPESDCLKLGNKLIVNGSADLVDRLCSLMKRNSPASTLVGVNPRTFISGGDTKSSIPTA
jgi:hypothetical protein